MLDNSLKVHCICLVDIRFDQARKTKRSKHSTQSGHSKGSDGEDKLYQNKGTRCGFDVLESFASKLRLSGQYCQHNFN